MDPVLEEALIVERQIARSKLVGNYGWGLVFRALVKVLIDEINILRNVAGLQPRTLQQAKNAIIAKIEDGSVDE